MALTISTYTSNDTTLITLSGRLINSDVNRFSKKLKHILSTPKSLVIDITNLTFINSFGLGILIYYHTLLKRDNLQLTIINNNKDPKAYINRLIDLTNINTTLNIIHS